MKPQFARNPTDAMQCFADVFSETPDEESTARAFAIRGTPVFFISAQMGTALASISATFPVTETTALVLGNGFMVFERPTLYLQRESGLEPVSGFGWATNPNESVQLAAFGWEPPRITDFPEHFDTGLRYIGALNALIRQKLASVTPAHVGKHVTKRIGAKGGVPECRVIVLRQRETGMSRPMGVVEWSCQWLVRGHWRKLDSGAMVWIMSYRKGPPEKPLKAPNPQVFAVVR